MFVPHTNACLPPPYPSPPSDDIIATSSVDVVIDELTPLIPREGSTLTVSGRVLNLGSTTIDAVSVRLRTSSGPLDSRQLVDDIADVMFGENPFREIDLPVRLVYAEWGAGPGSAPAYTAERVADFRPPLAQAAFLPASDHAATIMTLRGAAVVAEQLREVLR